MIRRTLPNTLAAAAYLLALASAAGAQPVLPPPLATDPVPLQLMQGFPPAPAKVVQLANLLKYPNSRWGFHHLRELGPTAQVWRGSAPAAALPSETRALDDIAFEGPAGRHLTLADWQRDTYTDALLVLHRGRIVYEKYHAGMQPQQPHALWSMTKSFTGLLTAQLVHEGLVDAQAPIARYLPELRDSAWGDATVRQALDMTVSASYNEDFADQASGIWQYIRAGGLQPSPPGYTGARSLADLLPTVLREGAHGEGFRYKTVDTEVLGWLVQRVTGRSYSQLLSERIWTPLRAQEDAFLWLDSNGMALTSVGLSATLGDLARFGEMMRQGGRFNGRQVIAREVVEDIRHGGDPEKFKAAGQTARAGYSYRGQWWIPHDASGSFEAKGLFGQHIHINPAAELVVVKLSSHPIGETIFTHALDRAAFAALAAAATRP
ncbi:MAG: serine hydrolase [Ramlibacter sp.]